MKRLPVKRAVSAGGVIYKREGSEILVLLVKVERKGGDVWVLPKGLVEKEESPEETAKRESKEETGVEGELVGKIGDVSYWYVDKEEGVRYHKKVCFYLFRYASGSPEEHDWEVKEAKWFPIDSAISLIAYPTEREIVEKAKSMILSEGGL